MFAVHGVDVAIEKIMFAAGGEGNGQSPALSRQSDNSGRAVVLLKEVVPSFQHVAVHQHDGACDVSSFGKLGGCAHAGVHHPRGRRLQGRSPRNRVRKHMKFHRRDHFHLGRSFGPGNWHGELFRVNRVSARGLKPINGPLRRFLERWSAWNASADLVGKNAQVFLQGT